MTDVTFDAMPPEFRDYVRRAIHSESTGDNDSADRYLNKLAACVAGMIEAACSQEKVALVNAMHEKAIEIDCADQGETSALLGSLLPDDWETAALPAIRRLVVGECIEVVKRVRTNEENRHLSEDRDRRMVPALVDAAHHCGEAVEVALRALLDTGDAGTEKGGG